MRTGLLAVVFVLVLSLSGCMPMDPYYPEMLSGTIKNGVYTTKVGNRSSKYTKFSIKAPQTYNKWESVYLFAREYFGKCYTILNFGPTATNETVFRVLVAKKSRREPVWMFKSRYFPVFIETLEKGYNRFMHKIYEEDMLFESHPAIYEVFTQEIPGYYLYISPHQPGYITLTHAVMAVDYGNYGVIFWVQANSDSGYNGVTDKNRREVIDRTWKPEVAFMRSFVFG